ncbi:DNA mismatch endonuclease Vsr [Hyphomonadaceae bacterium ML37]|nr:DNA mismatch endonuclease Vsr [Hyphomonadaceae bacterium ML37]
MVTGSDVFTPAERSAVMAAVKGQGTKPEMIVRRLVHGLGYRFRLHRKDLPGKPDLAFPGRRAVIFVNGCFWHGHDCARGARQPKQNAAYWTAKIARNRARDAASDAALADAGWRVMTVWECEMKDRAGLAARLQGFLGPSGRAPARRV